MCIPSMEQLWHVKKIWALWRTSTASITDAQQDRNKQTSTYFREKVGLIGMEGAAAKSAAYQSEMLLNRDLAATPVMQKELLHYFETGNVLSTKTDNFPTRHCNRTLFDPETKQYLHYLSHPFQILISASEAEDFQADDQTLLAALKSTYCRLLKAFSEYIVKSKLQITFDVGDCNAFMAERIPADVTFDVIDSSNLADNLGLINMLLLASPKMNRDEEHAILWVEFLKAHHSYSNIAKFLKDCLGFPYSLIETMLKLQCYLPFESSLLFDDFCEYSGKGYRSNLATGLVLKFKPIPYPKSMSPVALKLVPPPSECSFRQVIDNYLNTLYDIYTGRISVKMQSPVFLMSISSLLYLLCNAAQSMDSPRDLFDHLYSQVKKRQGEESSRPTRRLDAFAFDVQICSMCICPTEYQPTEPLHTFFVGANRLRTLTCRVNHTCIRHINPCPTIGWVMANELTSTDERIIQHAADPKHRKSNLFDWTTTNARRLQFIDSIHVPYPDKQVEIIIPLSPTAVTTQKMVFLALSLADGRLLYEPIVPTLTESEDNNLVINKYNLGVTLPDQTTVILSTPDSSQHEQESDELSVSHVFENEKNFTVNLHLRTPIVLSPKPQMTLNVSCDDQSPLCATLKLNLGTGKRARKLQSVLQMPASIEKMQRSEVVVLDEHAVQVTLKKNHQKVKQEKLNVELLQQWPVNRPLGALKAMFSDVEILTWVATGGFSYGHDWYLDARCTLHAIYTRMIDEQAEQQGIIKLQPSVDKLVLSVSSPTTSFVACKLRLLITEVGTPVIELYYAREPSVHEKNSILSTPDSNIVFIKCSDEEMRFLFWLLEKNAEFLSGGTSKRVVKDACLKRSFLVALYPKYSHPFGVNVPKQSESLLMKELDKKKVQDDMHFCSYCSRSSANLKRCGQCREAYYCNADCQTKDWARHRMNCIGRSK